VAVDAEDATLVVKFVRSCFQVPSSRLVNRLEAGIARRYNVPNGEQRPPLNDRSFFIVRNYTLSLLRIPKPFNSED
jgi:hypothetical protein